ncbi:unnamed protein product [Rotaria sordida]|uniref:GP-PDE domain-containing protein n=1 Tax=Rotaria sordida TaxID=392033 RepID=A0A816ATU8_9BILA|nr:unnamed protein product [Rotaria sordida]CAF1599191.1 unnamed protein product [Rotaria sordida]
MIRRVIYDVEFCVLVKENLTPFDSVLVIGSCEQLGEWLPNRCIPLNRSDKIDQARQLSLNHWMNESNDGASSIVNSTTVDYELPDEFSAIFGCYKGECRIDIGWLTSQSEIQLRFHSNALQIWSSKLRNNLNYQQENEEISSDSPGQIFTPTSKVFIQAALLRLSGCEANIQSDYDAFIEKDDYMIVKIQTFEPENIAYHIDFYLVDETTPLRKHIGFAYVLPIHSNLELADNKHLHRIVPIIGQLKVDVLLITPLEASFKGAFQLGFDFVEFDVQLSKDKIPVVYHDFQVAITLKRKGQQAELFIVPVKDLTLPQLQSLKIYHTSKTDVSKVDEELNDDEQTNTINNNNLTSTTVNQLKQQHDEKKFHFLFPTLEELFETLDFHLGFNVENKICYGISTWWK